MSIIITSLIPGVSYGAFLSQTEAKPFKVKKTSIISPTNAQVEQSTAVTYKDANGNRVDHVFTPTIDPYQELIGRIDDDFEYTFDGFTNIRFNQIAGNTTVVLKVYPGKRFDATNTLEGKPALLEIPGDVPYVFSIQNTGSAAVSDVDFGDAYTVLTNGSLIQAAYSSYVAQLTQSGNAAPTQVILQNGLGGTIAWSYIGLGIYEGILSAAFPANRTFLLAGNVSAQNTPSKFYRVDSSTIRITTEADGELADTSIEIRIY